MSKIDPTLLWIQRSWAYYWKTKDKFWAKELLFINEELPNE